MIAPPARYALPGAGRHVALVEDSPVQRKVLGDFLRGLGFEVVALETGASALQHLTDRRPHAVLCDVVMPGIDGFALCRAIKDDPALASIPVILLTSTDVDESDRQLAARAGAETLVARMPGFAAIVEALLTSLDGNPDAAGIGAPGASVVRDLRERFLSEGRREVVELAEAFSQDLDHDALRRALHRWAGRGATLGFPALSRQARAVEGFLDRGDPAGARSALVALGRLFAEPAREPPAASGPVAAVRAGSIPAAVLAGLAGRQVGMVGFTPAEADRIAATLARARARAESLEWREGLGASAALSACDLVILSAHGEPAWAPWLATEAMAECPAPILLVGGAETLLASAPSLAHHQILLVPWRPEALLLRAFLALHRPAPRAAPSSDGPLHIVVADDDPTILALLEATLGNYGYRCHLAVDGDEAIELVARVRPAAVIVDINMPGRDGYEVLSTLRAERGSRRVPVVLLTARQQEPDVLRAFDLGASEYIVKPFNPMELVARVRRLVET